MTGGAGDDTYVIDSTSDTVTEASGGGTDTIQTSVTLTTWAANVENMTLLGTGNLNTPTGTNASGANNVIVGNSGTNTIEGGAGDDTLTGGGGSDTLTGGLGADVYRYASGDGADTINNVAADSLVDRLQFTNLSSSQVSFAHVSTNLVITVLGGGSITVSNWFSASANRIDFLNFTNGEYTANQVDAAANGGGALNGSAPRAAIAARVAGPGVLRDFTAGALQDGPDYTTAPANATISKSADVSVSEGKKSGGYAQVHWEPIKHFLSDAPTTLGDALTGSEAVSADSGFGASNGGSDASLGLNRLIDAMAEFGAERNVAFVPGSELGGVDPLEQLAARQSLASGREFGLRHAALD